MPTFLVALLVGAVILAFLVVAAYNNLVLMRQNVRESWAAIETELRRRYDLIPNLVETVKGYAGHERETCMCRKPQNLLQPFAAYFLHYCRRGPARVMPAVLVPG